MRLVKVEELALIGGGDAAATRQQGQNSWGEKPPKGAGASEQDVRECKGDQNCMNRAYDQYFPGYFAK